MFETMYERIGQKADTKQELMFLLFGRSVQRFHTVPMLHGVTLGQHQFGVAWFVYLLLQESCSVHILMAALSHDMAEQLWGDIPAPGKRLLGIKELLTSCESKTLSENNALFPPTAFGNIVLKTADNMEGMLSCIHERRLGNMYAERPFVRHREYILELESPQEFGRNVSFGTRKAQLLKALDELWDETVNAPKTVQKGQANATGAGAH